jgi:hypothetical protein
MLRYTDLVVKEFNMPTQKQRKKPTKAKKTRLPKPPKVKPLGWLPTPPEIERRVRATINPIASEKAIRRDINYHTLSYYYGGQHVLVRCDMEDERGVEVIAVGEDVGTMLAAMSIEDRKIYCSDCPYPWGVLIL